MTDTAPANAFKPFTPADLDGGISRALNWLGRNQKDGGYWNDILETNCCMEAQWVLAMHFLGRTDDPKYEKIILGILHKQREDGSWDVYYDAPLGDINTTIECYAALRSAGRSPEEPALQRARKWILANGGMAKARMFTRFWLATIGEWPWETLPIIPPEIIRIPTWAPFNIYQFASWARATFMSMSVVSVRRPVVPLPADRTLDELYPQGRANFDFSFPKRLSGFWPSFFRAADKCLHAWQKLPWKLGRENSIKIALEWILKHQDGDGAWGGIQPPWIYALLAMHTEGYRPDHPAMAKGIDAWNQHWSYERDGMIFIQASESPVWDTLLAMQAVLDCGQTWESFPQFEAALDYVLAKQILVKGDWAQTVKHVECGGWAFERANTFYPDLDDTAVALMVLCQIREIAPERYRKPIARALRRAETWLRAMQSTNGGFGAFDKDNHSKVLTQIPFCDFGEVLDPPSADLTGHKLEALGLMGYDMTDSAVKRAVDYVMAEQEAEGPWFGRWGVNYIYGTGLVMPGLKAVGFNMEDPRIVKTAKWLCEKQNADGGWGETCGSYMDDALRGVGPSTASQTGWALMALLATGSHAYDDAIRGGVGYLLSTQTSDDTWAQKEYTGTGFPGYGVGERILLKGNTEALSQGRELARGFMLNYHMYRHYFPLMALARAKKHLG